MEVENGIIMILWSEKWGGAELPLSTAGQDVRSAQLYHITLPSAFLKGEEENQNLGGLDYSLEISHCIIKETKCGCSLTLTKSE